MTHQEANKIAIQVTKYLELLLKPSICSWISEAKVLSEFPFTKDQLRRLRDKTELEYRYHWKSVGTRHSKMGAGRSGMKIYHRERMIEYVNKL